MHTVKNNTSLESLFNAFSTKYLHLQIYTYAMANLHISVKFWKKWENAVTSNVLIWIL